MTVYVASDCPLPTPAWDQARPDFYATELDRPDEPVRRQFTKPYVYYVGSHEGCGCGFQYGEYPAHEKAEDVALKQDSRTRLAEFLTAALRHQPAVELFACWSGDESTDPEFRERLQTADLTRGRTFFREREFVVVSDSEHGPHA